MTDQAQILSDADGRRLLEALKLRLAAQLAPRAWQAPLLRLSDQLEDGRPFEELVDGESLPMPSAMRSLLREALRVNEPGSLLLDAIKLRNEARSGWQALAAVSIYPAVLFILALIVGVAFSFSMKDMVSFEWVDEFGLAGYESLKASIEDQHNAIVGLGLIASFTLLVLATIAIAGPAWAWPAVAGGMIVIGKPLRWLSLQELLNRFQLFSLHGLDPALVPSAVARSFENSGQEVVSRVVAARIEQGMPLGKALGRSLQSDGLCRPALLLIDYRGANIQQALAETAGLLGRMAEQRCRMLVTIVPIFALALVGTVIWGALGSYILTLTPLVTMISWLA